MHLLGYLLAWAVPFTTALPATRGTTSERRFGEGNGSAGAAADEGGLLGAQAALAWAGLRRGLGIGYATKSVTGWGVPSTPLPPGVPTRM